MKQGGGACAFPRVVRTVSDKPASAHMVFTMVPNFLTPQAGLRNVARVRVVAVYRMAHPSPLKCRKHKHCINCEAFRVWLCSGGSTLQECSSGEDPHISEVLRCVTRKFYVCFFIRTVTFLLTYLKFSVLIETLKSKKFIIGVKYCINVTF